MSVDSELHERAQAIARTSTSDSLEWRNDRYIDMDSGKILAILEQRTFFVDVLMNGSIVAQFVSSEQAKRWVEEQNL